ncbi:SGM_5486 family transporter-associated protein [Streptomyces hoynatensis]|nr:SGM_5486 family transporter-associated protein [Streptomyces hoynatensis]
MPALDPNPTGGHRMLLMILGAMLGVTVLIGIIATVASP